MKGLKIVSLMAMGSLMTIAYQKYSVPLMKDMKQKIKENINDM